jgi:transcriptional regulator with XRE-family HTH domain
MNATATNNQRTASKIDQAIGERIRLRRLELGKSQEQLAHVLGITFQQIQKYEKGVNRVSASRLLDIADALELPVGKFFEHLSKKSTTNPNHSAFEDVTFTTQLSTVLAGLSDKGRLLLLETGRTFARQESLKRRR